MAKMARKKRPPRTSNPIYYFIVEGCTEENYLKLLRQLYKKSATITNCEGGSAKNVLKTAQKILKDTNPDDYLGYIIWFDNDRYDPSKDANLYNSLKSNNNVTIYISLPCMENWLLAHFEKVNLQEPECDRCEQKLKRYIKNYDKNDCSQLQKYIIESTLETAIINYAKLGEIIRLFKS